MTPTPHPEPPDNLPITAVERETGIGKDTLRIWEKRYGFPQPLRDSNDDRRYPPAQVQRLQRIRRLLDAGYRPGKVVPMSDAEMENLLDNATALSKTKSISPATTELLDGLLHSIATHQSEALRAELQRCLMRKGLGAFVHDVVAPLTTAVGDAWAQGRFEVFEEHFYTEAMTNMLRSNLDSLRPTGVPDAPKVLLTTVPQEQHGLGLLMVESVLTVEGCACTSLGTQTPLGDIVHAASAYHADIVALSFTNMHSAASVHSGLRTLRQTLPAGTALWVGGSCTSLYQKPLPGITALQSLHGLPALVSQWRQTHRHSAR